jgi:3-deoxy-D-manno-octulosonic-acid transferase
MFIIYSFIYYLIFVLALPFYIIFRKLKGKPPIKILSRLGFKLPPVKTASGKTIWIHAVSVGEVMAARPLILQINKDYPDLSVIMSMTTETGWNTARSIYGNDVQLVDFPLDFGFSIKRYIRALKPALVIIMETELWPRFCLEMKKRAIPLILVNGRLSDTSFPKYCRIKFFIARVLRCFSFLIVQTAFYRDRFIQLGADPARIRIASSLKYHISNFDLDMKKKKDFIMKLRTVKTDLLITGGSTHEGEEDTLISVYKRLMISHPNAKLIIAPRRPERFSEVEDTIKRSTLPYFKLSEAKSTGIWQVMLADRMGELKNCYSVSRAVFVGGSLIPHGGQNLLEAAAFSVPVIFGPHIYNFLETADMLLDSGGGFMVRDESDLYKTLAFLLDNPIESETAGRAARSVIDNNQGGLEIVMSAISKFLIQDQNGLS